MTANSDLQKALLGKYPDDIEALLERYPDIEVLLERYPDIEERVLENITRLILTVTKGTPLDKGCQREIWRSIRRTVSRYDNKFLRARNRPIWLNLVGLLMGKCKLTCANLNSRIGKEEKKELAIYFWRTIFAYKNSLKENIKNETVIYWLFEAIISARRYIDLLGKIKEADENSDKKFLTPIERERWNYFLRYVEIWRKHSIKSLKANEQASMNSMGKTS
ncbi:MAG: hypothetical protein ACOX3T_04720 [Bdellovibrionota bacterium]